MDLNSELEGLRCRVIDAEDARTQTHQEVLLILAQTFDQAGAVVLCEPSVVGGRSGPPDIAILDPVSGLHVFEIKGVPLSQVRAVRAGGALEIAYDSGVSRRDPSRQARQAMFDIKDAATRNFNGDLNIEFQSWVVFPRIGRSDWEDKFGNAVALRPDVIFREDLASSGLGNWLRKKGGDRLATFGLRECPSQQMRSVLAAFGDSEVLRPAARPGPPPPEGSKGEQLDQALAEYRVLTELQQRLTSQDWNDGPRLVRGVAGSGKTVVLATQAARMIERLHKLLRRDGLLPQEILVLTFRRERALQLANAIADRVGPARVRCPFQKPEKDGLAIQPDQVTVSTVASAKGYDAPYVMLASLDEFTNDVKGRVSVYVGCTRAREWLDVSWVETTSLVREFERSAGASGSRGHAPST